MTPRRAQGVKSAAGEVVAVKDAQGTVELLGLLAAAPDEASAADAEPLRGLRMAGTLIAAAPPGRAARHPDQGWPPPSPDGSIFSSSSAPQKWQRAATS
jgi:hypothetical protein